MNSFLWYDFEMDAASEKVPRRCPECGLTEAELYTKGLMGCPMCYRVFVREVRLAVEKLHGVAPPAEKSPWVTRRAE